ncbi:succinylglutamate desuccinylase/aspartoacylase family protein [Paenibacillus swuensis]|uniref:succinylglutamate desuccinylase/aspartoacylase family protein n=1 Tax=Paenibacillus swuensis TaxID=1178515 RepID=UPI0008391DD5|nr:succinylglutamate desuccinylase/aspartoacylase family protein [Paenibacillus swuensis]
MNMEISIDQMTICDIPRGTKTWLSVKLLDTLAGPVCVPIAIIKGDKQGPVLLATAGVHGDEFEGMEAIRSVFKQLQPSTLRGTFVGVPVVNPFAYEGQMRETPALWDGLNLARTFPGSRDGTVTQQLAKLWSDWVLRILGESDVFVDFHSAGTRYEYVPIIAFHQTRDGNETESRELAQAYGIDRVWRIPDRPDTQLTFNGYIARQGIPTIATEVRGRGSMEMNDVSMLEAGLIRLMQYKNMIESVVDAGAQEMQKQTWSTEWAWVHTTGFFKSKVQLGERVIKEQILGEIVSISGQELEVVKAPVAGEIWGIRVFNTIRSGDYALLIGYEEREQS